MFHLACQVSNDAKLEVRLQCISLKPYLKTLSSLTGLRKFSLFLDMLLNLYFKYLWHHFDSLYLGQPGPSGQRRNKHLSVVMKGSSINAHFSTRTKARAHTHT